MARPVRHRGKWRIRWIDRQGKRRSEVYTSHKEAEHMLRVRQVEAEEIRSGIRPTPPLPRTLDSLCDYWLEHRAPNKRSGATDRSIIRKHFRPTFGALQLADITVDRIDEYISARRHLAKQTVNNQLTLLITMLNLAVDLGWLNRRPKIRKHQVRLFSEDYRWLRTTEELDRFLRAARDEGTNVFALYCTAAFTGMRLSELAVLRWDSVSLDRRLITVHRGRWGPTKGRDVHHAPILDPLLPVLRSWRLACASGLVFPNRAGNSYDSSARIFNATLHRVLDAAGFPKLQRRGKLRRYITFHDLRHTFASRWVLHGGDIFRLQKILGHKTIALTMRYAHLEPSAFADDYARLGDAEPGRIATVHEISPRKIR